MTSPRSPEDYYAILGVRENATSSEIKNAYHKLALKKHPDKSGKPIESKEYKQAEEIFKKLSEAYDCLADENKRRQYDALRMSPEEKKKEHLILKEIEAYCGIAAHYSRAVDAVNGAITIYFNQDEFTRAMDNQELAGFPAEALNTQDYALTISPDQYTQIKRKNASNAIAIKDKLTAYEKHLKKQTYKNIFLISPENKLFVVGYLLDSWTRDYGAADVLISFRAKFGLNEAKALMDKRDGWGLLLLKGLCTLLTLGLTYRCLWQPSEGKMVKDKIEKHLKPKL